MKTCHYNTKKNRKKQKNRVSICQNVKISKYPYGFSGTRSVSPNPHMFRVRVWTCTRTGAGFAGTGPGWTARTRARPVCHPKDDKDELKFGVIFLEHLLCKLVRWQGRFEKRARTDFVRMGYDAQVKDNGWIKGLNVSDETGLLFPIPLMASDSQLHTSIDKSLE